MEVAKKKDGVEREREEREEKRVYGEMETIKRKLGCFSKWERIWVF